MRVHTNDVLYFNRLSKISKQTSLIGVFIVKPVAAKSNGNKLVVARDGHVHKTYVGRYFWMRSREKLSKYLRDRPCAKVENRCKCTYNTGVSRRLRTVCGWRDCKQNIKREHRRRFGRPSPNVTSRSEGAFEGVWKKKRKTGFRFKKKIKKHAG